MNPISLSLRDRRLAQITRSSMLTSALVAATGAASLISSMEMASAQTQVAYSNVTTFSGFGAENGDVGFATSVSTGTKAISISSLVADDLTISSSYAGDSVTQFTFSLANFNTKTISFSPIVYFFNSDGAGGGPGTFLAAFSFYGISVPKSDVGTVSTNPFATGELVLPAAPVGSPTETIWAGVAMTNSTSAGVTNGVTTAQLALEGQGLFNPPTIGSSQDEDFETTGNGSYPTDPNYYLGSNPTGNIISSPFGGAPVADFGWALTATVPAPSSLFVVGLGGLPMLSVLRRRRSAKK